MLPADSVFVGRTAGWLHRLELRPADPVEVAVPGARLRSRAGLSVRHVGIEPGETVKVRGLLATNLHRTLLDLCARSTVVESLIALDSACRARLTDREKLRGYADCARGRPGAPRFRKLVEVAEPAESPMETRLRWLLINARLPRPEVQTNLHDDEGRFLGRADLYYPSARLVIEFDGGNHRERLISDDRRQNLLVNAGFRVLRFTAADLGARPDAVEAQVRGLLLDHRPGDDRCVEVRRRSVGRAQEELREAGEAARTLGQVVAREVRPLGAALKPQASQRPHALLVRRELSRRHLAEHSAIVDRELDV